ncbi:hypothetical protein IIC68_03400 [archaeon]|nr:hypothetical protein [archaeon]
MTISKRAINVMKRMAELDSYFNTMKNFMELENENIAFRIGFAKQAGRIKGCGAKTIAEIIELHETLNNIWE